MFKIRKAPFLRRKGRHTVQNAWDELLKYEIMLTHLNQSEIDRGANFFIGALWSLGARTYQSCEGHPNGFYITFSAPYATALKIQRAGYFSVEIEGKGMWSIRLNQRREEAQEHVDGLRWAAKAWEVKLGTTAIRCEAGLKVWGMLENDGFTNLEDTWLKSRNVRLPAGVLLSRTAKTSGHPQRRSAGS